MNTPTNPLAKRLPTLEPRYFVNEEEAERIEMWSNEIAYDGDDEQTVDENASQYQESEGSAVNAFFVLQNARHIHNLEDQVEATSAQNYIVVPAENSEADDGADLYRIPQQSPVQAARHDQSQAPNRPPEKPREQQQHPDTLAPLLPGWNRLSAPPPTLPPVGPLLDKAQRFGGRAASRLTWNQEPYEPQSPRLYEYVYSNQPPEGHGQDQQPQLVQQRPYEHSYHPPEQFQHQQPLHQYQDYQAPQPPQQYSYERHHHHQQQQQLERYHHNQQSQHTHRYHNYQQPESPQQYRHEHVHQQPEQYEQHQQQQKSQPGQHYSYEQNHQEPEQHHQHQQHLQPAQQDRYAHEHHRPEAHSYGDPVFANEHNGYLPPPIREQTKAPPQAVNTDATQNNTLVPGHLRPTPANWVSENEMTPGHREARMEALELEYHIHELDYKVWLRQCELRRKLERQQRR